MRWHIAQRLAANLRNYIAGFSPNMREVLEKFDFDNTIAKLDEVGLLFKVMERFRKVVSEMLGHSSVNITLNLYSHVLPDMQKEATAAMERLLNGRPEGWQGELGSALGSMSEGV